MNILHTVSSFVSIKKASGSQGIRKQIIAAVKALPYDETRWTRLCSQAPAVLRVLSAARRRDPESQLFWESLLEAVRVVNAKHHARVLRLENDEADLFMCLLQALLDFIPRGSVYRLSLVNTLLALVDKVQVVPRSLFVEGVEDENDDLFFVSGFGGTKQAKWKGKDVALKTPRYSIHLTDQRHSYHRLCREVLLWRQLRHPHLVEYYGILNDFKLSIIPTIVSPWMDNGTVLQYVRKKTNVSKITLLHQVARALNYLHRNDPPIIHQDIRCSNILINGAGEAVLGDFGLSIVNPEPYQDIMFSLQGRRARWFAPELLFSSPQSGESLRASRKTDIYAFGMVILELFTEASPFSYIAHDAAVVVDLFHGGIPRCPEVVELHGHVNEIAMWDDVFWRIMERCWLRQPKDRPSASMLVKDLDIDLSPPKRVRNISVSREEAVIDSGYSEGHTRIETELPQHTSNDSDDAISIKRASTGTFGAATSEDIEFLDRLRRNMGPEHSRDGTDGTDDPFTQRHTRSVSPEASSPFSQEWRSSLDRKELPDIPLDESNVEPAVMVTAPDSEIPRPRLRQRLSQASHSRRLTRLGLSSSDDFSPLLAQEDGEDAAHFEEDFEVPVSPPIMEADTGSHDVDSIRSGSSFGAISRSLPSIGDETPPASESSASSRSASLYRDNRVTNRPSMALPPFKTVSRPCYEAMFRAFPDLVASIERIHGVNLTFKFCRSWDGEAGVEVHVSTNGDLPDILSAQWEIEKIIEFYSTFCAT